MKCEAIQTDMALYGDGRLPQELAVAIEAHFEICPLCRAKNAAHREIVADLRQIERPQISSALQRSLRNAVAYELNTGRRSVSMFSTGLGEWLQMRIMPYAVGVAASLVVGLGVLTVLLSNMQTTNTAIAKKSTGETSILLASNRGPYSSASNEDAIFPADYARTRVAVSGESPSLNPQGALVMLTSSMLREGKGNDGVVIVADVFSDGLAQIQEVVSPSYDSKTISDLEKALDADLGDAPFVPASLDQRSDSVRVVLRFQQVNVSARQSVRRRR